MALQYQAGVLTEEVALKVQSLVEVSPAVVYYCIVANSVVYPKLWHCLSECFFGLRSVRSVQSTPAKVYDEPRDMTSRKFLLVFYLYLA